MTRVALIFHDETKPDLISLAQEHEHQLETYDLIAIGTTVTRLREETDLDIERKESGPLGGDLMIGAEVDENRLDGIVFLRDPLTAQLHEPDISALLRICDVHDVALATNCSSAAFLITGLAEQSS